MRLHAVAARLVFVLGLILSVVVTWSQLVQHATWQGYTSLAQDVTQGRSAPGDIMRLELLLAREGPENCVVLRAGAPVTLHLYAADLLAHAASANPIPLARDPRLASHLQATRAVLEQAIACAPMDGNLWLSLAITVRALDDDPVRMAGYLALSERYAPHEHWISVRRGDLF